ncbi:MAG: choice-of-anchor L domain-containing protein [Terriglobia bacterium]
MTSSNDATQLAQALAGPGITITSATLTESNDPAQQGLFSGASGVLPFDSGIALTNGSINNIPGPNNSSGASQNWGGPGYAPLELLNGNTPTFDANVLTFTFVPTGNQVSFQYVFGSEEYNEFVNAFNDVFAFYLNGTNIALIPGTSSPIAINSVNCMSNSQFYTNNDPFTGSEAGCSGNVANPLDIQYDGLVGASQPLFATGSVTPNQPNTITLAIADTGDGNLDSGVMIAGNSFVVGPPPSATPEPASLVFMGTGLLGLAVLLRKRKMLLGNRA